MTSCLVACSYHVWPLRNDGRSSQMSFITIWRPLWSILYTFKDLAVWILLAYNVWRHEAIYHKLWAMSKARKQKHKGCHATHQQPSDWALWCLGNRLYGSISPIKVVWVHLGGSWLHLQVGRGITLQTRRQHQFKEDVWRNHISKIGVPRVVISDGGAHFIDKRFKQYLSKHGIHHNVATPTILRQVVKQRLPTSKSRIFFRKQLMRWEQHGKTSYPMHSGHTGQHTRPQLECLRINWCTGTLATYLLN